MADTPEGRVKAKVKAALKAAGAWSDFNAIKGMGSNGRPDVLLLHQGRGAGVECKKENVWRVSDLQRIQLNRIFEAGGSSMVINLTNVAMLERWLAKPAARIEVVFGDTERSRNTVKHHVAYVPGHEPVVIKNPGDKPGKTTTRA